MHAGNGQLHQIDKSRQLQRQLYLAAKKCRERRFHALYDRIFRPDVLWRAWQEVKANGGSAGVDGVSLEEVERQGVAPFLEVIAADLKAGRHQPQPVLRRMEFAAGQLPQLVLGLIHFVIQVHRTRAVQQHHDIIVILAPFGIARVTRRGNRRSGRGCRR